jgi:hypothetical protein
MQIDKDKRLTYPPEIVRLYTIFFKLTPEIRVSSSVVNNFTFLIF